MREEVKEKILKGIDKEELVLLKFTREQSERLFKWEHSREFEYQGEMYDIVDLSIEGDTIHYLCWKDHKETQLKKDLADLTTKAGQQDTRHKKCFDSLNRLLSSLYFENCSFSVASYDQDGYLLTGGYPDHYISIIFSPPTPPPQWG